MVRLHPAGPDRDRPQPGDPLRARSDRLWRAHQRHQHRHRFRRTARCSCHGRRRPRDAGGRQFPRQQPACAGASSRRPPDQGAHVPQQQRQRRIFGRGQRTRHAGGDTRPHLRILFHHQAGRGRHRHRPVDLEIDRRTPQRQDLVRGGAAEGRALRRRVAGDRTGGPPQSAALRGRAPVCATR